MRENYAVADVNFVLDYFRRSADHRLLFGGRVSYSGIDARDTGRATRAQDAPRIPAARGRAARLRVGRLRGHHDEPGAGLRPPRANLFYLQGFSGHGIAMAGMAGRLAARGDRRAGGAIRPSHHRSRRRWLRTPALVLALGSGCGPALRTPALVLGMLWYSAWRRTRDDDETGSWMPVARHLTA